jgi:TonB-linked SusC/RagA family outer membrane protein
MAYKSTVRRLMQVFTILLICLSAYRDGFSQNNDAGKSVTITAKRTTYGEIFDQVLKQTGTTIWFTDEIGKRIIKDVSLKNTPLQEAMNKILPKDLEWLFRGKDIVVKKKGISESGVVNPNNNPPSKTTISGNTTQDLVDVTGRVTDENGDPIPGATVLIKGTPTGTISNESGNFIINGVAGNEVLTISYVSFISREIPVRRRKNVGIIALERDVKRLDETVVLAYTTTTGRKLTGNVSSVKAKAIENSPVSNPILAVAGRVPGVTVTQSSGFSGGGVEVIIQGMNSLTRGVTPFYVIDGVPFIQSLLPNKGNVLRTSGTGTGDGPVTGSPLAYINPSEIESIEILKDADATAIYGSRAANGAIIITTKRGASGDMRVSLNVQSGFGQVSRKRELMNTSEYLTMRREAKANDGASIGDFEYDINGTWDTTRSTDWQKELIGKTAGYTDAQISVSGGPANVKYFINGGYHKETTVLPSDLSNTKASVRFNLDSKSTNQKFSLSFSGSYLFDNNKLPVSDLTDAAMTLPPNYPKLRNPDGSLNWAPDRNGNSTVMGHPLAQLSAYYSNKTGNLISNAAIGYKIFDFVQIKTNVGFTKLHTDEVSTSPASVFPPEQRATFPRSADFGFNDMNSWIFEPQILVDKKIANIDLNGIVGMSFQENNNTRKVVTATGFPNDFVLDNINAATSITSPAGSAIITKYKYNAGFFLLNLNYKNTYILNVSGRRDGSSRFGADNRFHNFAAIGGAWLFSNESEIQDRFSFLSFGKLKASYGSTGNDQIGDYNFLSLYYSNNSDIPYRDGGALNVNRIANPALQWEETKKLSIGLDLGFFNDKILVNTVYFRNRSSNMLVPGNIPATAGPVGGLIENMPAVIQNSGWEFLANSTNIRSKKVTWSSSVNLTVPRNQLVSFGTLETSTYASSLLIGQPVNFVKVYRANGVNPATGQYEFFDKDGKITNAPGSDPQNYNKFIDPNKRIYGGVSNTLSINGNFSIDFLFQFVKQMGRNELSTNPPGFSAINQPKSVTDRWQKPGDHKPIQRYASTNFDYYFSFLNQLVSDAYWQDASYIRLKNLSISYTLNTKLISKAGLRTCRLYLLGQNLWTITGYDGLDPESLSNLALPPLRVFTFGVQATF